MELTDPSIMSSSLPVETDPQTDSTHIVTPSGQEADLQQFIKFLRNKNDSSKTTAGGADTSLNDEFQDKPTETIESIVDYKPDTSTGSKIYVYSINELLDITKNIPKEYIEEKAETLPKRKFWRLYQRFPDNGNHKSNFRNNQNNNSNNSSNNNNNNNNNKSRTYSNDANSNERRNHNRNKNGKNSNSHVNGPGNKKKSNKSMALTSDELEFDANFESSGNAIADFEAWKSQMKEMERQKKFGGANSTSSSSSMGQNITPNSNRNDNSTIGTNKPSNAQSSIISDFLNLSRNNNTNSHMNTGNIIGSESSNTTTTTGTAATTTSTQNITVESTTMEQQHTSNGSINTKAETASAGPSESKLPADLSRSSSSRFTSFFSNASSSSSSKPLDTQLKNSNSNEQQETQSSKQVQPPKQPVMQQQNQPAGSSRLMGFFNKPSPPNQNISPEAQQGSLQSSKVSPTAQQPGPQQQPQQQMPMNLQMQLPPQPVGMQPGNNMFFQNLLNKNKKAEDGNQIQQNNGNQKNAQFNQMQMPPPGMGGPPMGHPVQVLPPGLNNFNNKDKKGKNDNAPNGTMQMPPHMGMPPPHMMQGNFNMPPPPGFPGFPPQGQNFQMPVADTGKGPKASNKEGSNESKGNVNQFPSPQQFMQMRGPPPPGFMPMQGMPPNMPYPPNGMMLPSYPPQHKQEGKNNKSNQMNPQQGFFPPQMAQNPNFPMNPNMPLASNQQRSGSVPNQNKK
ncbi:similar to Saccharomyces cerevisiae YKL204W EAP1 eIF4E-associated protein, competes with eIF4G for binding to eIF4E [Maudiozyma saulgeensis]|uniref:Similar to Saccharomyces cerevisiae YKL204W EAP1 eIF4E-associated protein, competes with eIF4G for binding to eIF4E n=1 Tax=Maudiozyma saulgeensis TaxID=1789683 RepID=A0A1X7R0X4_9SACH|nr:similar to Saccharomyces cerevisiae YKL204W EAP1 eIF4E-associated protein, competes with eIF4G for binding to eIF4E [Kazachstania saulgeensis]